MTYSEALTLLKTAKTKVLNRKRLTQIEEKAFRYDTAYDRHTAAKRLAKNIK